MTKNSTSNYDYEPQRTKKPNGEVCFGSDGREPDGPKQAFPNLAQKGIKKGHILQLFVTSALWPAESARC